MKPHSGTGGRAPIPRKLRPEAMTMLSPIRPEAYTKIGLKMFGSTCDSKMLAVLAPLRRAASMYSRKMTRRGLGHPGDRCDEHHADRQHRVRHARSERRRDGDREHDGGEGVEHVHRA